MQNDRLMLIIEYREICGIFIYRHFIRLTLVAANLWMIVCGNFNKELYIGHIR